MTSLNAKEIPITGGNTERPPALDPGTYPARVVQIISLGVQKQRPFQGEEKPPKLELLVTYEMLDEFLKDEDGEDILDKPRWVSERFTFNNLESDLAKSTKRYMALDPKVEKDGDWSALIGTPCMVSIVVTEGKGKNAGRFYENVSQVSAMRPKEADKAAPLVNPSSVFNFYEPDMEVWERLPQWIQNVIKEAVDYEGSDLYESLNGKSGGDGPKTNKVSHKTDELEEDTLEW